MSSEVSICNRALIKVGCNRITSLSDNSKEARLCNQIYDDVRDAVLRGFDWSFATKRLTLSLLTETAVGWLYVYTYPPDCHKAREIYNANQSDNTAGIEATPAITYEIALSSTDNKRVILTDQEDAVLIYTAKVTDTNLFGADFEDALTFKLAAELAMPLRQSEQLMNLNLNAYREVISGAKVTSANESKRRETSPSTILDSRL